MKKLFFFALIIFSVFIIYFLKVDRKVYYLALGSSLKYSFDLDKNKVYGYSYYVSDYFNKKGILESYVYEYSGDDLRISDLINDIEDNKKYGDYTLKNSLIKADLVSLGIDASDVYGRILTFDYDSVYDYIDGLCIDFEKLLEIIREYCKEDIVFIGYVNPYTDNSDAYDIIDYLNKRYKEICEEYGVIFVDISGISLNSVYDGSFRFDGDSYKKIGDEVRKKASKSLFEG